MQDRTHLDELLEAVKKEFESLSRETTLYKDHHQEYEMKINQQHQELASIRNTVYELEQAHRTMKDAYEKEILRLKQDLENRDRLLEQQSIQQQQQVQAQAQAQHQQQQAAAVAQAQAQAQAQVQAHSQTQQFGRPGVNQPQIAPPNLSTPSSSVPDAARGFLSQPPGAPGTAATASATSPAAAAQALSQPAIQPATAAVPTIATNAFSANSTTTNTTKQQQSPAPDATKNGTSPVTASPTTASPAATTNAAPSFTETPATTSPTSTHIKPIKQETVSQEALVKRAQHNKPIPAFLKDFDSYNSLPYKKQQSEYYVVYNPKVPKKAEISLVHSFDHTSVVCCVRFSKDGKFLATGCNKLTQVFSVETGDLVARLSDESSASANGSYDTGSGDLYIRSVSFSPDGKFLATGAEDKIIRIWDLATRTVVKYLKGHEQDIYSLDFFPDGTKLVSGSGDRTVRIWDVFTGQCSLTLSIEDGVTTVAVSPDGKLIAAGSLDRTVRVWDANQGFLVERLDSANEAGNGHMDSVYSVTFTHDGHEIVSGSLDRTVKLWSLKDLQRQQGAASKSNCEVTYVGHKDFVLSVCCTPDDEFILSGSKDRGVILWDKLSGEPYIMLQGHRNSVISVSVSPVMSTSRGLNGGYFATGSGDCKARIWKWERVSS
ncbi:hypothetical protein FOA43_002681 [Brettanomyces nanus]|uniref:Transcriptional repressor Tup1 N-terminal domain-containing protein n=1 Tax=Eeniella nana TaxID=13502 RepID=A0A875S2Z5_EENNA|nr:uncharacterized protein FOA43_002681 [Brettanomyces nanus]QPG75328.1 hypothetical protein FOA43_002681 [Brettanomyces nanus]